MQETLDEAATIVFFGHHHIHGTGGTGVLRCRPYFHEKSFGVDISNAAYALDATAIDLCLSVDAASRSIIS